MPTLLSLLARLSPLFYPFLMVRPTLIPVALFVAALFVPFAASAQTVAPTPPMGWNSWDSYGLTIDEDQFKANATVLAGFEQYGWKYAVIDEGWYMANPGRPHSRREKLSLGR